MNTSYAVPSVNRAPRAGRATSARELAARLRSAATVLRELDGPPPLADLVRHVEVAALRLSRPPRVAVIGEFSAGKSTLINVLVRGEVLPESIVPSTTWPTLMTYAPDERLHVRYRDRSSDRRPWSELGALGRREPVADLDPATVRRLDVAFPAPRLREMELLDTPGLADPDHDPVDLVEEVSRAHVLIWCTLATQAWRATEAAAWSSLPERLRRRSVLVVTHADALNGPREREKVLARTRGTAGFAHVALVSGAEARAALDESGAIGDRQAWAHSGLAGLEEILEALVARAATAIEAGTRKALHRQIAEAIAALDGSSGEGGRRAGSRHHASQPAAPGPDLDRIVTACQKDVETMTPQEAARGVVERFQAFAEAAGSALDFRGPVVEPEDVHALLAIHSDPAERREELTRMVNQLARELARARRAFPPPPAWSAREAVFALRSLLRASEAP